MRAIKKILNHSVNYLLGLFNLKLITINNKILSGVHLWEDLGNVIDLRAPLILDVGANVGQTIDALLDVFPTPTIYSFEPSSSAFEQLSSKRYGSSIHLVNAALGEVQGSLEFNNYVGSTLSSFLVLSSNRDNRFRDVEIALKEVVPVSTVDDFINENSIEKIDLLKIDTQGFDLSVLKGARKCFEKNQIKHVLVEINFITLYNDQADYIEILEFLNRHGFALIDFYEKERRDSAIAWTTALFKLTDEAT